MSALCGHFQAPALNAALSNLRLGTIGRNAQLAGHICNDVHEHDVGDDDISQCATNAAAIVDAEADMVCYPKVPEFEARAAAAWQEHNCDGAFVLDDLPDTSLDAEEADVRAEQEALHQLDEWCQSTPTINKLCRHLHRSHCIRITYIMSNRWALALKIHL